MQDAPDAGVLRQALTDKKRIVLKIGSAVLAQAGPHIFSALAAQIARARGDGREFVIVSSGAIALGLAVLGMSRRPQTMSLLQAAAAAGQPDLIRRWGKALGRRGMTVAQVLLTHSDLANRERFLNARHALAELLGRGVVPIVNENDSVATDEIRVGDNDNLSANVANLVGADLLIILTTVDGLFDANPETEPKARRIEIVTRAQDMLSVAGEAGRSGLGVGGMRTKVEAAQAGVKRSIPVVIARGEAHTITRILRGEDVGTLFIPAKRVRSRKHWIGFTLKPRGRVVIDAGAENAIRAKGTSLLPSGLVDIQGSFQRGDMVEVHGSAGPFARGLVSYSADELRQLRGCKTAEIASILGYVDIPEIIHRDDMVLV